MDHFVSDCRKRVQLEELRDDLELYYKLLKTAMVELINKDYADFVNLSTNLVSALHFPDSGATRRSSFLWAGSEKCSIIESI